LVVLRVKGRKLLQRKSVGNNQKVAPAMLTAFGFTGKKTVFGRVRRRKTAAFSSAEDHDDENIKPKKLPKTPSGTCHLLSAR